jgi:hypothetical protein
LNRIDQVLNPPALCRGPRVIGPRLPYPNAARAPLDPVPPRPGPAAGRSLPRSSARVAGPPPSPSPAWHLPPSRTPLPNSSQCHARLKRGPSAHRCPLSPLTLPSPSSEARTPLRTLSFGLLSAGNLGEPLPRRSCPRAPPPTAESR